MPTCKRIVLPLCLISSNHLPVHTRKHCLYILYFFIECDRTFDRSASSSRPYRCWEHCICFSERPTSLRESGWQSQLWSSVPLWDLVSTCHLWGACQYCSLQQKANSPAYPEHCVIHLQCDTMRRWVCIHFYLLPRVISEEIQKKIIYTELLDFNLMIQYSL